MNKTINVINNIIKPTLEDISKFLKRDFFELRYLKDEVKLKAYFGRTKIKNLDRIMHGLLKYNPTYGIIHENKIIIESPIKLYWDIKVIDDFANYVNFIPFWGVYIGLISMEVKKLQIATYYMPMQEEFFMAYDNEGCFLGNKKLILLNSRRNYIQSMDSSLNNRIFGSNILTMFYVACERINIAELKNTSENQSLAELIITEAKGKIILSDTYIKIASPNLI